jgi:hypothetical protein
VSLGYIVRPYLKRKRKIAQGLGSRSVVEHVPYMAGDLSWILATQKAEIRRITVQSQPM